MSPSRSALFEVHFVWEDEFLDELAIDVANKVVERNLVRLTWARRPAPNHAPNYSAHYIEAAYTTLDSNQLIRLSHFCGYSFDHPDGTPWPEHPGRTTNTAKTLHEANQAGTKVKNGIRALGLEIRAGGLFIEGKSEQPIDHDRTLFLSVDERCRHCGGEIYYANQSWRHRDSKRTAVYVDEPCAACNGTQRMLGRPCGVCVMHPGVRRVHHHDAEPVAAAEVA